MVAKDIDVNTDEFWQNGYLRIRNVFDREEVEEFRTHVFQSASYQGDLLSNPLLRNLVLDERILSIAQRILGGTPVYFGDSSILIGPQSRGYHKDNGYSIADDIRNPEWGGYSLIRFGLYLQDHSRHSGGLNVRVKSHKTASENEGRNVYLATEVGDLTVWSLRTSHSGNGVLLKFFRGLHLSPRAAWYVPGFLLAKVERERVGIFLTFGLDDHYLKRYIYYLKIREYAVTVWRNSKYDSDVWKAIKDKNLVVRNMWEEIKGETALGWRK